MIPRFAQRLAKLIAICILIAATCHAMVVIWDVIVAFRNPDIDWATLEFGAKVGVWALAVVGALGLLQTQVLAYYVLYLATILSVFLSFSGYAFSYIPFEGVWLPKSLTAKGQAWLGICLVNVAVIVVLMWCHRATRILRGDSRLKELRQQSKGK